MTDKKDSFEVEVKLPLRDLLPLNSLGLAAYEVTPRHFEDNWLFDTADRTLYRGGAALRVRFAHGRGVVTYKGPAQTEQSFKVREEIESGVDDPQGLLEIFRRLGYEKHFRYQKYRTVLRFDLPGGRSLAAMFDETPLGNYLELEGGREEILEVAGRLGFAPDSFVTESYPALQRKRCAEAGRELEDLVFAAGQVGG